MSIYLDGEKVSILEYIIDDGEPCAVVKYSDGDVDIASYESIEIM